MLRKVPKDKRVTHYSKEFIAKMTKVESLNISLNTGSKKRLNQYQKNLASSRGIDNRNFDSKVVQLLQKYALHPDQLEQELEYLKQLTDPDGYKFSRNLKIYNTTEESMNRFSLPDHTSFRWNRNYQKSLKELRDMFSEVHLNVVSYNNDDDIRNTLPKVDTHSGFTYIYSGNKEKGENMDGIYQRYCESEAKALENGTFNKPILIGFRTQASGEFDDEGLRTGKCKHKLRVVSMIDLILIIAELKFAKPIQQYMGMQNFYAGGKDPNTISSIITNWRSDFDYFRSIDYTSFDQTISSWLIEDAFSIIKCAFHNLTKEQEQLFDIIVHDFIHKDFILNEGVLHSDRGVPSGSMFTQIIGSLVNIIAIKTYYNSLNVVAKMITMGDDNAIFTNCSKSIDELASYLIKNFGLIVKTDDKSNEGRTKVDDLKFLSRYWRKDGQWRHPNQLLSRLAYPERWRNYSHEVGPQHVIFAFILTYKLGMEKLIDTSKFLRDYPISSRYVVDKVDSRYLPGAMAYIREYS